MNTFSEGVPVVVCDVCQEIAYNGTSDKEVDICPDCQRSSILVDNFNQIQDLMTFRDKHSFYWVQVLKRRKDNPGMHGNSICYGSYCFYSYEDLMRAKSELVKLSRAFNARVMFWVNPRNMEQLALPLAQLSLDYIQSKHFEALPRIFEHACGKYAEKGTPSYIVDVDTKDAEVVNKIIKNLKKAGESNPDFEIRKILSTLHGFHIICTGFKLNLFSQLQIIEGLDTVDVHKDNPTVLYFCPQ